jgi:hypothetical protein
MKNLFGMIFSISLGGSVILILVSLCNYLIAYQTAGQQVMEAFENNTYVRYWVNLTLVFLGTAVGSFFGFLLIKPKASVNEDMQVMENRQMGAGPVDEYVTVRVKKDELSKLQG